MNATEAALRTKITELCQKLYGRKGRVMIDSFPHHVAARLVVRQHGDNFSVTSREVDPATVTVVEALQALVEALERRLGPSKPSVDQLAVDDMHELMNMISAAVADGDLDVYEVIRGLEQVANP